MAKPTSVDFSSMSKEELVSLLEKIKEIIEWGEDSSDMILSIAEKTGADTSPKG